MFHRGPRDFSSLMLFSNLLPVLQVECAEDEVGPLTPDSGTFCPSDYGEAETSESQNKIKKSTSLQFPRCGVCAHQHKKLSNCLMRLL